MIVKMIYICSINKQKQRIMEQNWWIHLLTALIPLAVGTLYYSPLVAGNAWMKANKFTEEDVKDANMPLILGVTYVASLFISVLLSYMVVHQLHLGSILIDTPGFGEEGSPLMAYLADFNEKYGDNFRTFKHGAFHGAFVGLLFAGPIILINALFERKSFRYTLIHTLYWMISLALMGGVISAFF